MENVIFIYSVTENLSFRVAFLADVSWKKSNVLIK